MHKTAEDYHIVNGTFYDKKTTDEVIQVLRTYQGDETRLVFWYGDTETGRAWGDKATGRLGRSSGPHKVPLVIHNSRSMGGGHMLDQCIVKIETARGKRVLYQHPLFHHDPICSACNAPRPDWSKPCPKCRWP